MHVVVTISDPRLGTEIEFKILTPRAWLYSTSRLGKVRATWQIDYVKYIIAKILWAYKTALSENSDSTVKISHSMIWTIIKKMYKALEVDGRYLTRHGKSRYLSISQEHVKKALQEASRKIREEGLEKFIDTYLIGVETDYTLHVRRV